MAKQTYKNISPAELLKINPRMLRAIHSAFGIDWNKPLACIQFDATPTKNAVIKTGAELQIPGSALVLMHRTGRYASDRQRRALYYFIITAGGMDIPKIEYDSRTHGSLENTWRKSDFDEWRKDPNEKLTVFAVYQAPENRTEKKPVTRPNEYTRYIWTGKAGFFRPRDPESYKLISIYDGTTASAPISYYYRDGKQAHDDRADIIDKSGYYVQQRREDLQRRAAALKAERARNNYSNQDTEPDAAEIEAAANETRLFIASAMQAADLATAGRIMEAIGNNWRARYAFPDAIEKAEKARAHGYKDRTTADADRARVLADLAKIRRAIENAVTGEAEEAKTA